MVKHRTLPVVFSMEGLSLSHIHLRLASLPFNTRLCLGIGAAAVCYWIGVIIYNVFFHPLSAYPGPFWARASFAWRVWHTSTGRFHRAIDDQHKLHGDIVRISPNELSFASVESWKAIYQPKKSPLVKSEFYEIYGSGFNSLCIGSERNPKKHNQMRKSLAAAFSTKALLEQEEIVQGSVDAFIEGIRARTKDPEGINMTKWFEMLAFDILGEMAFGESFHCIENGKPHFWSEMIEEHLYFITILDNLRRYPLITAIGKFILPHLTTGVRNKHTNYSRQKVARRLDSSSPRADFMSRLIAKVQSEEMDMEELTAHASTLVIAGGETVATFLAAVTYHLLSTPEAYKKLRDEIRGRYKNVSEIDSTSALQLPYLQAVISEGLRIYPPGSQGFPRVTPPEEGIVVNGKYVPGNTEVYTSAWTVTHDARYFHEPFEFKPQRWLDPECTDNKEASQPFSLGPRGCLGRNFAMVEMSIILSKLHFQFDAELVDPKQGWESESRLHVMWWKPNLPVRFFPVQRET